MRKLLAKVFTSLCLVLTLSAQAPPPVNRPTIQTEQKADRAIQNHQAPKPETQGGPPTPAEPPSLPPPNHATNDSEQRGEEGTEFWPSFGGYRVKITDSLLVLFTAVLAIVTGGLHVSTKRLWLDSREQTRIQSETREIALAALDRPYVIIDSVSYRLETAQEGKLVLYFDFKMQNYGKGPAIIQNIVAYGFLSSGVRSPKATDDYPAMIFPSPDKLDRLLGDRASVRVFPEVRPSVINLQPFELGYRHCRSALILRSGEPSPTFVHLAKDANIHRSNEWIKLMDKDYSQPVPWLIGKVTYTSVFGKPHRTQFCFRGRSDGIAEEDGEAPYNERT